MALETDRTITFGKEVSPADEEAYKKKIAEARQRGVGALKNPEPVGVAPRPTGLPRASDREVKAAAAISESGGVQPRPAGSPLLSPGTAKQLQDMAAAQVKAQELTQAEEKKEEEKKADADLFDMFDFQGRNEAERVLNNKKRRQEIEGRCAPMNLEDLILKDEVTQLVPVVPDKFEVTYRSMTPEENLYIKRYIAKNDQGQSDQYVMEKFGILQLVCSVVAINGRAMPEFRKGSGEVDDKAFDAKLAMLLKKSGYVIADLGINYYWFDIRVRKLLNPDALGNG
jgi:hypothetical protein